MNAILSAVVVIAAAACATQAAAEITLFARPGFEGPSFTTSRQVANLGRFGFNDHASSLVVARNRWEVCEDVRFSGRCVVLRPGRYPSLASMRLNNRVSSVRIMDANARIDDSRYAPVPLPARITFYERERFQGRSFTAGRQVANFQQFGFNNRASSVEVLGDRFEVCENPQFSGHCIVLRPGLYPSLSAMGLNNQISSMRIVNWNARIDDHRYAPDPIPIYDSRRHGNERLYEANVTAVRAVVGTPEQRCWVERQQVPPEQIGPNVPGAIFGAIIGGILGHQVGSGSGRDIATGVGVVGGGLVGANVGRGGQQAQTQEVQRCASLPRQTRPDYWDVVYNFRGQDHRVQVTSPPGRTITVNEWGEPRS